MGFGQSKQEKVNDAAISDITKKQSEIASDATTKGDKSFKWFKQTAGPAKDFLTAIEKGDRSKIMEVLGPEVSSIKDLAAGQTKSNAELTPRGGMRASGESAIAQREASSIGDMILNARTTASDKLMQLAGLFSSTSLGETGAAIGAGSAASSNLFGLNKEQADVRATQAQFWGGLGQSAGNLIGAWAFGKKGGG